MRLLAIALAILPLSACGVAQTAMEATQEKRQDAADPAEAPAASSVTLPVPDKAEPVAEPQTETEEARFRSDFGARERFVAITVENSLDVYVLDRTTGCVYSQDEKHGREPVLDEGGRPDCSYEQR